MRDDDFVFNVKTLRARRNWWPQGDVDLRGDNEDVLFAEVADELMSEWFSEPHRSSVVIPVYVEPEPVSGEIVNDVRFCVDCSYACVGALCAMCCVGCA